MSSGPGLQNLNQGAPRPPVQNTSSNGGSTAGAADAAPAAATMAAGQ